MVPAPPPAPLPRKAKRRAVLRKLKSKYRLLLINDATFEERFSIRLSRINVILLFLALFTLHGLFVTALIVFTPAKRYIPGYSDQRTKLNAYRATVIADSLQQALDARDAYIANVRAVLSGRLPADSANLFAPIKPPNADQLKATPAEHQLRTEVRQAEAYSVTDEAGKTGDRAGLSGLFFFPPLRGVVTSAYDRQEGHFGVDIVTKADEAVKACLDGTVILASWTSDAGNVLQVQHGNDLVSVYKHNAVLLKRAGDRVKAGEAIAIVGNSGELTTGPHLHFELWSHGEPLDPQAYIVFK